MQGLFPPLCPCQLASVIQVIQPQLAFCIAEFGLSKDHGVWFVLVYGLQEVIPSFKHATDIHREHSQLGKRLC